MHDIELLFALLAAAPWMPPGRRWDGVYDAETPTELLEAGA